jgi:type II secretory pathway pseudopilin PulG
MLRSEGPTARLRGRWFALLNRVRRRADDGFMLLESVIAISIITIVMGAVGAEFIGAIASTDSQRTTQTAIQLGDSEAERVRSIHPSDLVLGRDQTSVTQQFATAPKMLQPDPDKPDGGWLAPMNPIWDSDAVFPSGRTATLPTFASSAAPITRQKPDQTTYTVLDYLGSCFMDVTTRKCNANRVHSEDIPYLRDVIAVTWTGAHCADGVCGHVTAVLISAQPDQTFQVHQPLPPAPIVQTVSSVAAPNTLAPIVRCPAESGGHCPASTGLQPASQPLSITATLAVGDAITPQQLQITNDTGVAPFIWQVKTGTALPSGVLLSPVGLISGTVGGSAGTVNTTLVVTDAYLRSATATITWTVEPPLAVTYSTDPAGVVSVAVSPAVQLTASGGEGTPYTWSLVGNSLPTGLTMSSAGVVSGTPTRVGVYAVTVKVTDPRGRTDTRTFNWSVNWPPVSAPNPSSKLNTVGAAISPVTLVAGGGDGTFVWSDPSGSLPSGLTVSSAGVISGKPNTVRTYNVTLQVADPTAGSGPSYTKTVSSTWTVVAAPAVTTPSNQTSSVGAAIDLPVSNTCPNSPCSYVLSRTDFGVNVNASGHITGTIGGAPGTYSGLTVTVTDAQGVAKTSGSFSWVVNAAPTISKPADKTYARSTSVSLPLAGYVSGGTAPISYAITGLPSGLTYSATTGVISGTTANANSASTVTVTIKDGSNVGATATFNLYVSNLAITVPNQWTSKSTGDSLDVRTLTSGGTGPYTYSASNTLPGWLALTTTGIISGTAPGSTGTSSPITLTVTDSTGASVTAATFTWGVVSLKINTIPNQTTPRTTVDSYTPSPSGGSGTLTWSATGLPGWLTINSSTGKISGTGPGSTGTTNNIVVMVTDSTGVKVRSNPFSWSVT